MVQKLMFADILKHVDSKTFDLKNKKVNGYRLSPTTNNDKYSWAYGAELERTYYQ